MKKTKPTSRPPAAAPTTTTAPPPKKSKSRSNPSDAYASARAAKLDQQTPKWPELRVSISDSGSTISASGITHDLAGDDPQTAAVTFAAEQARTNGKPIRMTATMATGDVHRMIITPERSVILLDHARPAGAPPSDVKPPDVGRKARTRKPTSGRPKSSGFLSRFPPRLQPIIKWGGPAFIVILVALIAAAILKGPKHPDAAAGIAQQDHPAPAPGILYTVTAPPGWSQTATWTVPLADQSVPYTDPDTGVTAALTPDDRTTTQTAHDTAADIAAHKPNYLSVLSPDGSTRFTEPLTTTPAYGPVITTVDGAKVVLLQESPTTVTYWPITGGTATAVNLPDAVSGQLNTTGPGVMVPLSDQRVAYLHHGAFQTLEALPLTTPMFALDGSVISVQPETGAWWSQRIDASPASIKPTKPAGVQGIDQILAITPQHAIISWKTPPPKGSYNAPDLVAAYDVATGELIAQATSQNTLTPAQAVYYSAQRGLTAANGIVLSTPAGHPAKLTLIDTLQVTAAYDAVYGQDQGQPAVINAAGVAKQLPASALTPVGITADHLMVASQNQLYALPADPSRTAALLPTFTTPAKVATPAGSAPATTAAAPATTAVSPLITKPAPVYTSSKIAPKPTPTKVVPRSQATPAEPTPKTTPKPPAATTTSKITPTTTLTRLLRPESRR